MIPEAAVEAAARAQYGHDGLAWDDGMAPDWECEDDSLQDSYRTGARAALEAAAPHMMMRGDARYTTQYKQHELGDWKEDAE